METESDQLWRLESALYSEILVEQLAALRRIGELWAQLAPNDRAMGVLIIAKSFQKSASVLFRHCIVQSLQQHKVHRAESELWGKILQLFSQDLFTNFYKFRITSLLALQALLPRLNNQFDLYHQVFETFLQAQEDSEVHAAFITLRQLTQRYFESSFIKKLEQIDFSRLNQVRYVKIAKLLCLLKSSSLKEQYQLSCYTSLGSMYSLMRTPEPNKEYLIALLHFFKAASHHSKLAYTVLEECFLGGALEPILSEQSQQFVQSFLEGFLRTLRGFPSKGALAQKDKLVNLVHHMRDQVRGIQNLPGMTRIQKLIPKINSEFGVSIEVKQNIFNLETKQYSQQSILIDEYFSKLVRMFETMQRNQLPFQVAYEHDFLIKSHRVTLIDVGYQNIDKFLSDSISNIKKQKPQTFFAQTQFLLFLSHLLELLIADRFTTSGKYRKQQEQILSLNKLISKYTLECIKLLFEVGLHARFQWAELQPFLAQLVYLLHELNEAFYIVEHREIAQKDIVTERLFRHLCNDTQYRLPFGFVVLLLKISMYFGCLHYSAGYLKRCRDITTSLHVDTYLDYLESLLVFLTDPVLDDVLEMNRFQTSSVQMDVREAIIRNYYAYHQLLVSLSESHIDTYLRLQDLLETIDEHYASIVLMYNPAFAEDCYGPHRSVLHALILHFEQQLDIMGSYDLSHSRPPQQPWIGLRLALIDLPNQNLADTIKQILQLTKRAPKLLVQIKQPINRQCQ